MEPGAQVLQNTGAVDLDVVDHRLSRRGHGEDRHGDVLADRERGIRQLRDGLYLQSGPEDRITHKAGRRLLRAIAERLEGHALWRAVGVQDDIVAVPRVAGHVAEDAVEDDHAFGPLRNGAGVGHVEELTLDRRLQDGREVHLPAIGRAHAAVGDYLAAAVLGRQRRACGGTGAQKTERGYQHHGRGRKTPVPAQQGRPRESCAIGLHGSRCKLLRRRLRELRLGLLDEGGKLLVVHLAPFCTDVRYSARLRRRRSRARCSRDFTVPISAPTTAAVSSRVNSSNSNNTIASRCNGGSRSSALCTASETSAATIASGSGAASSSDSVSQGTSRCDARQRWRARLRTVPYRYWRRPPRDSSKRACSISRIKLSCVMSSATSTAPVRR